MNAEYYRQYAETNRETIRQNAARYRKHHPGAMRANALKHKFGVSAVWYLAQHHFQGGLCAICKQPSPTPRFSLAVDHDHDTGKVRELLCINCNSLVGAGTEKLELLKRAVAYVEHHRE